MATHAATTLVNRNHAAFSRAKCIALLTLAIAPSIAIAGAPFCEVDSGGQHCYYYNIQSCLQAARLSNGACVANQDAQQTTSSGAPFCVVSSSGAQCTYYDFNVCRQAAQFMNGACVANAKQQE